MSPSSAGYPTGNAPSVIESVFISFHSRSSSLFLQPRLFVRTSVIRTDYSRFITPRPAINIPEEIGCYRRNPFICRGPIYRAQRRLIGLRCMFRSPNSFANLHYRVKREEGSLRQLRSAPAASDAINHVSTSALEHRPPFLTSAPIRASPCGYSPGPYHA